MRKIELKSVPVTSINLTPPMIIDYREQITEALRASPVNGVDFAEMERVMPLIKKVKDAGKHLLVEEAEFQIIVEKLKAVKFKVIIEEIYHMMSEILNVEEYSIEEAS